MFYLFIFVFTIHQRENKNDIIKEFLQINGNSRKSNIYFHPYKGCGFANTIPTLISSILLSLLSYHPMFIVNWKALLFYYKLPNILFISHYNKSNIRTFNKKNINVLRDLKIGLSVKIYTYHSFTQYIYLYYKLTNKINKTLYANKNIYTSVDMYIQDRFLIPEDEICGNIKKFKIIAKKMYVIGVHIRTGYLSDFGEKDKRFFRNGSIFKYIKTIDKIIKRNIVSKLYVISDSTIVANYIKFLYKNNILNYEIPGAICHSKYSMYSSNKSNKCVMKLISENYILSECNIIVGSRRSTYFAMASRRKKVKSISID